MAKNIYISILSIASLCLFTTTVNASDFSIISYFFRGLYIFSAAILLFIVWRISKHFKYKWGIGLLWGITLALITTPMNKSGGNGTINAAALESIFISLMGGDNIYAIEAVKSLLFAIPFWYVICTLFFFLKERQDKKNNEKNT